MARTRARTIASRVLEKGRDEKSSTGQDDARHAIAVHVAEGSIPV